MRLLANRDKFAMLRCHGLSGPMVGYRDGYGLAELSERDLRVALSALRVLAEQSMASAAFIDSALEQLTGIVASDLTTLSICDLQRGSRRVVGRKGESLSAADRAAFDRHFREHPLVRFHSSHPGGPTQRISDCMDVTGSAIRRCMRTITGVSASITSWRCRCASTTPMSSASCSIAVMRISRIMNVPYWMPCVIRSLRFTATWRCARRQALH